MSPGFSGVTSHNNAETSFPTITELYNQTTTSAGGSNLFVKPSNTPQPPLVDMTSTNDGRQSLSAQQPLAATVSTDIVIYERPTATPVPSHSPTPLSVTATASSTAIGLGIQLPRVTPTITSTPLPSAWPQISVDTFQSGFSSPVDIANAGDGTNRIFIVERCGTIKIIANGSTLGTNFLNITNRVNCSSSERGLLSMTFPPDYASKNYFYVFYTQSNGALNVSRFHVPSGTPDQADSNSEEIILTIPHSTYSNHNGGKLLFGNDGYLYFSVGDGGGGGDPLGSGQNINTLLGKILRIDVESGATPYAIPPGNPFVGVNGLDEIWAYGLRNPWRISFDRLTHDLYIADVGQGAWEEIDVQFAPGTAGRNYGWNILEGNHCYPSTITNCTPPSNYSPAIAEYSHSLGCSITGGYVYRGNQYSDMQGVYFYGDYCTGRIWGLKRENGNWYDQMLLDTTHNISTFGEDEAGNLYLANLGNGAIYKINSTSAAAAPLIAGCPSFPQDNVWNARVDTLPLHSRSSQWIDSIGRNNPFHMDFGSGTWNGGPIGIPYNILAGSSVTNYTVNFYYPDESDAGPYPIASNPNIEWGSDHHIITVDTDDCTLYELYDASYSNGQWSAGSGAIWNLYSNVLRPDTWTSADAAGLPLLPGLVRYEEILAGKINHAIRFTAQSTNSYIWPARHLTSGSPGVLTSTPPMGARFRLKASFNISTYPADMQVLLRAMQQYGIILADNGSNWYISGVPNENWDNDMLHLLDNLTGDEFEAVDTSSLMINENSGQATP